MTKLGHAEKLQLLKFVCAAAWADLEVTPQEKTFVLSLALKLGVRGDEAAKVERWLETPPEPEEVDPASVPPEHRRLFLQAIEEAVEADHVVDGPELDTLRLLRELLS